MATAKKASKQIAIAGVKIDPQKAVEAAVKALQNPTVREGLAVAGGAAAGWAGKIRKGYQEHQKHKAEKAAEPAGTAVAPDGLTARFGQKGLERRVAELREASKAAFSGPADAGRLEFEQALDGVDRYLAVVARMPLVKRKPAHWKADDMLDELERGLLEAVSPGAQTQG